MDTADWKQYRDKGKEIRSTRLKLHREFIHLFAREHGLDFKAVQDWQLRVSDGQAITVDFFPKARRYHNISSGKRGSYHNLQGFISSVFHIKVNDPR
jgi:hypothetical protein